jgi:hypothetical protein
MPRYRYRKPPGRFQRYQTRAYRGKVNWSRHLSTATKALALARQVKGMVNVEYKKHTVQQTTQAIPYAITPVPLTIIARGDTDETRDGGKLRIKWYTFNYLLTRDPSSFDTVVRILIILDTQTNQALFSGTDLFQDATIADNLISGLNLDNAGRFRLLYDRTHVLKADHQVIVRKVYKKCDLPIQYDATTGAIADQTKNSLALCVFSNQSTHIPTISYQFRARFIDN